MAQSGYTPILIYGSGTASNIPSAANLTSSANGAELALNYADGKLYYKNSAGTVTLLADKISVSVASANGFAGSVAQATATSTPAITISTSVTGVLVGNGTAVAAAVSGTDFKTINSTSILGSGNISITSTPGGSTTQVQYNNAGAFGGSANFVFDGTNVGIGTSSPGAKLDVVGALNLQGSSTFPTTGLMLRSADNQLKVVGGSAGIGFAAASGGSTYATIDSSGNLGLGVTPSGWSNRKAFEGPYGGALSFDGVFLQTAVSSNCYYNGTNWIYKVTNWGATRYETGDISNGAPFHKWYVAASGTAGNTITFTQAMTLDASGNLGVGTTSPNIVGYSAGATVVTVKSTANNQRAAIELYNHSAGTTSALGSVDFGNGTSRLSQVTGSCDGATDSGNITFRTVPSGGSITERARITSGGDFGIGTSSPQAKLHVAQTSSAILFSQDSTTATIVGTNAAGTASQGLFLRGYPLTFTGNGGGGAEQMRLDSSGNLGIGLTPVANNGILQLNSYGAIKALIEGATVSATAATGTINYDAATQAVVYYTSNASANWTVNFRGSGSLSLNSMMQTGQSLTVAFLVTQGSTAYYNSAVQVDGSSVTPKWQGGTAPSAGNASSIDSYVYTIIKTGSAAFTVLASQTKFA